MFLFQSNPIYLVPSYVKKFYHHFVCLCVCGGMEGRRAKGGGGDDCHPLILQKLVNWPKQVRPLNTVFSKHVICL